MDDVTQETNKYKRAWIWLWYNNITRVAVLFGIPVVPLVFILNYFGVDGNTIRAIATFSYLGMFFWAVLDNDYSNLKRIGMDVYRKKLK